MWKQTKWRRKHSTLCLPYIQLRWLDPRPFHVYICSRKYFSRFSMNYCFCKFIIMNRFKIRSPFFLLKLNSIYILKWLEACWTHDQNKVLQPDQWKSHKLVHEVQFNYRYMLAIDWMWMRSEECISLMILLTEFLHLNGKQIIKNLLRIVLEL